MPCHGMTSHYVILRDVNSNTLEFLGAGFRVKHFTCILSHPSRPAWVLLTSLQMRKLRLGSAMELSS